MTRPILSWITLASLTAAAAYAQVTTNCTPATLPQLVGTAVSVTCAPLGGTSPYSWSISSGVLPAGLSQDPASGSITGQLADPAGAYNFTVTATDSTSLTPLTGSQQYSGATVDPVTVTCTSGAGPVEVGVQYTNSCTASGGLPPFTWKIVGTIVPQGLPGSITTTGNPATITFTPTVSLPVYQYNVQATDSSTTALKNSQAFSGAIAPAVTIATPSPLPSGAVGSAYSQQFAVTGGVAQFGWSATGLSGTGLSMNAAGLLAGTPTTAGPLSFTVNVTDAVGGAAGGLFALTVNPALTITTMPPLLTATVGTSYTQAFGASGGSGTGYSWAITAGSLPAGLSLSTGGVISGTPLSSAVTSAFTITVTDSNSNTASGPFSIPVTLAITTTSPLPAAPIGTSYSQALAAVGGSGGYKWAVTVGSLPAGLSLSSSGVISGTPLPAAVNSNFTVTATDSSNSSVSAAFAIPVPLAIITTTLPAAVIGTAYNPSLVAGGGAPGGYTWVAASPLPSWLKLNTAGVLQGTPPTTAVSFNFEVTVTDTVNASLTSSPLALLITLSITTTSPLPAGAVGTSYSQTLTGQGGLPPYTWSLAIGSTLPDGLSINSTSGLISGSPTTAGTFPFTIQLGDSTTPSPVTTTKPFSITISGPLTITTTTLLNATVGFAYSQTLVAAGGTGPYTWTVTKGTLPAPLSLSTAGVITGTPTATGSATFTVTVTDSTSTPAKRAFTLTIVTAPVITTASPLPNGAAGAAYSQTLAASGGTPPYKWIISSGSLPAGLSLSSAGAITGNPSAGGTSNFTVQLTDSTGVAVSKAFTLTIIASVTISTKSPLPAGELTIAYSQTLAATGGAPPYTWALSAGALPLGLTLSSSGTITGTPNVAGTYNLTVQVSDSTHATASATLMLTIASLISISTPALLNGGSVGSSYSQDLQASAGVSPYTWSLATGTLPGGLNLSGAGVISGTPTTKGSFAFTIQVRDVVGATASRQFTIAIATGLTVSSPATLPGATVGSSYSYALQASGGTTPYTWTVIVGSVPAGLTLKQSGGLSGVPSSTGSFTFTVQVQDSAGHQASEQLSLTVAPALTITTGSLPGGTQGAAYSQTLAASGGTPPYTWSIAAGALPGGLSFSAAGAISGTINATGTATFTVQVADSLSVITLKQFQITVAGGLSISTAATLPEASTTASYSQTLTAAGGTPPYTWAVTAGALPAGLTLSTAGEVGGLATASGTFHFTATVTDSASATASQSFTLTVVSGLTFTTTSLPNGEAGTAYSQTLAVIGGTAPYTFTKSAGSLPPGITITGDTLGGTPTVPGSYTFTIEATDSVSATATQQYTIVIGGLAITTSSLPGAAVGTAYSQAVVAAGTPPYTWAITKGTLPGGLSFNSSSGIISGTPTAAGSFSVTVQVTDNTKATASQALTLLVISGSFSGLSGTATAAQQVSGTLALGTAYPLAVTGQVTLTFQPEASLASPADDPSIQFSGGGRTVSFTIPANSTAPVPFSLQTGTVAGTITVGVTWQAGGAAVPSPAALTQPIQIAAGVPVISAVTASTTSSGFQVVITGYSTTREVTQATLQFTAASGQTLQTTSLSVPLTNAAPQWFQSSTSDQYGSQFILTLPFTVTNGAASAIGSISVQLVNSQGTSASAGATL